MTIKRNNVLFMLLAILFMVSSTSLQSAGLGWNLESVIPYLICFGIGVLMLCGEKDRFFDVLPFNVGLKPLTALLIVALTFLIMPFEALLSGIGGLIGGDTLDLFASTIYKDDTSFIEMFFSIAIVPAFFEELFFRGFFYAGFKRARGARFAIIMTAILFGFFHMNVQQILYAAAVGILIAILREVTGSMWAGCLFHLINNGYSVIVLFLGKLISPQFANNLPLERVAFFNTADKVVSTGTLVYSIAMVLVCTAAAFFVLRAIIKREDRLDDFKRFFKSDSDPKDRVVTAPFVIGCIVFVLVTIVMFCIFTFMTAEQIASFIQF